MSKVKRPILAITMGDPAGIGPEIIVKSLGKAVLYEKCRPLVIGPAVCLQDAVRICNSPMRVHVVSSPEEADFNPDAIDVLDIGGIDLSQMQYGKVQAQCGDAAFRAIVEAIELAMDHRVDGTITAPLNKEALNLAGHHFSGHTEIYAEYTHTKDYTMMLAFENLRVVHVSTHVSLAEACRRVKKDRVLQVMRALVDAATSYGSGELALTSRMTIEVQGIPYENIENFDAKIAELGLAVGGTGSKVRPVVPCKGTVCVHGLIDTMGLAKELHETFYLAWHEVRLPHKFKIGVGGCPNNCIKPQLNDFGIWGQKSPAYDPDMCSGCKKCAVIPVCPVHACSMGEDGIMVMDKDKCNNCGKCIGACNFDAIEEDQHGYAISIGGIWGKTQRIGNRVPGIFTHDELIRIVEKCLLLYREQGETGERFGRSVERIGVDNFITQLLSDDVLDRKQAILDAPLHLEGGATC